MYPPLSYDTEECHPHKKPLYSHLFIPFSPGYLYFHLIKEKKIHILDFILPEWKWIDVGLENFNSMISRKGKLRPGQDQ